MAYNVLFRQLCLVLGTTLNTIGDSSVGGFATILVPKLKIEQNVTGIYIDNNIEGMIIASPMVGMFIGVLPMSYLLDKIGRKPCLLATHVPVITGWLVVIFANSAYVLIVARILQGIGAGMRILVVSIIVGECTSPKYRGFFLSAATVSISLGFLYIHVIGSFFHWRRTAAAAILPSLISFLILIFQPESPIWFVKVGRIERAKKTFVYYRGDSAAASLEFHEILENQRKDDEKVKENISLMESISTKEFSKPLCLTILLCMAYPSSGIYVLAAYSLDILTTGFTSVSPYFLLIVLAIFRSFVAVLGCVLVKKFKRRYVLHFSSLLTITSLLSLSSFMFFDKKYGLNSIFIVIALFTHTVGVGTGLQNLPYVILGEIFPVKYKALSSTLSAVTLTIISFLLLYSAPSLFTIIGKESTFCILALIVFLCWISLYFKLPETKDKSLVEIEKSFKNEERFKDESHVLEAFIDKNKI